MTPERWHRIEAIFDAALERPEAERIQYVDTAAAGDTALRDEVVAMLRADGIDAGPVDSSIAEWFRDIEDVETVPQPGTVIGAWQILGTLGEGGMGTVYRARRCDGAYDQEAALKLLHIIADEQAVRRFAEERQMLARLSHPGIARLLDGGTTPAGEPFLVMELVNGERIDSFVERNAPDARARFELVLQIGSALEHAHRNLIVHGDIKPANVLVDEAGRPRLLDFGIARMVGHGEHRPEEHAYLTPGYASPERLRGAPLTTAADVYSMGVLLDRLLSIRSVNARSKDLSAVIAKARHPTAEMRYESVASFCDDLRRMVDHRPVLARRQGLIRHAASFARRNALATSLAAIALLVLVASTIVSIGLADLARDERDAARLARQAMVLERDHAAIEAESAQLAAAFLTDTLLASRRLDDSERERLRAATLLHAARTRRQFADQPHLRGNLLDALAGTLARIGCDDDAEAIVREVLALRVAEFGADSLEVALSLQSLGELMHGRGRFDAALAEFERAYDIHRSDPSSVHADVATAANNIAACLRALGRGEEARRFHEEALSLRLRGGRATLPVAETLNNLGVLALDEGDDEGARAFLTEAVATRRAILGADAPLALQSAMNLASAFWRAGETGRAIETLRSSAAALREQHGAGDDQLLHVLMNLAGMELVHGESEAGLASAIEAQQTLHRLGQSDTRSAMRVRRLLARAHKDAGRHAEAALQHRAALALLHEIAPDDVRATLELRVDLALCLVSAEDFVAASPILQQLHELPAETLGGEASLVAYLLAACESHAGRAGQARALAAAALPSLERRLGSDHAFVRHARAIVESGERDGR